MMGVGIAFMVAMMVGMFAGGALFMHHEGQHKKQEQTVIQGDHDHGKTVEYPSKIIPADERSYEPGP